MSRRPRIQAPGGTYYIAQFASRHQVLFHGEDDHALFQQLLQRASQRAEISVLAFCCLPDSIHLALWMQSSPSRLLQGLTSSYARYVHRRTREVGHLFRRRYRSILIEPSAWLPELVRYIHDLPVQAGLVSHADGYPHSSASSYGSGPRWLDSRPVRAILRDRALPDDAALHFLTQRPTPAEMQAFRTNGPDARALGNVSVQRLTHRSSRRRMTLNQLVDRVAMWQAVSREELVSRSRRRRASLARALIAWHATELRIASFSEVGRLFARDVSTLSKAVSRYRARHPRLFRVDALPPLSPLF